MYTFNLRVCEHLIIKVFFIFFLGMKIIQVECTQRYIFLEKKCIN